MQRQQIRIAGDNHVCPAVQRDFQEHVVFGVAAFPDEANDGDELGCASDLRQEKLAFTPANIAGELWPGELAAVSRARG